MTDKWELEAEMDLSNEKCLKQLEFAYLADACERFRASGLKMAKSRK
jgi:hypothetical protein